MQSEMNRRMRGERKENRPSLFLCLSNSSNKSTWGRKRERFVVGGPRIRPQGRKVGRSEWVGGWVSRLREIINCAIGECDSSYAETTPSQREGGWVDKKIKNRCRVVPRVCAQALSLSLYLYLSSWPIRRLE